MNQTHRVLWILVVSLGLLGLGGCQAVNPWAESFSPADFHRAWPPVQQARAVNVGHVDPGEVAQRDFADTTRVGTAVWSGYRSDERQALAQARAVGADLVLFHRRFAGTDHHTTYDHHPGFLKRRRGLGGASVDRHRAGVLVPSRTVVVPRTQVRRRYTFSGVFLRTAQAGTAGHVDHADGAYDTDITDRADSTDAAIEP